MRIENTHLAEHLGSVKMHGVRRVLELDSGAARFGSANKNSETLRIEREAIESIESRMAIVLPVKNEDLKVFEGVLSGVPHDCLIIAISNSQRGEVDCFKNEQDILHRFCQATQRQAIILHQKDPFIASAIERSGYVALLDDEGYIRSGKSEGMILGILLAAILGKDYVGFIDTDNFIPGAVWEYAKHYAMGFSLASSPYSMVRILWHYKPKISGDIYFKKWGRVSEITNRYINHFLSARGRFETEIIKTANAGEHAMSLDLAMKLSYASGYGIETQELISIFEQFGTLPITDRDITEKGVEIIQTETVNPHLHEERNDGSHLYQDMLLPSLSVIYHSPACEPATQKLILDQLIELGCIQPGEEVPRMLIMPPPQIANMQMLKNDLEDHLAKMAEPRGWTLQDHAAPWNAPSQIKKIVYTDLDGTLLHPVSYSYTPALESIRRLQEQRIPIVFCSAKTYSEQDTYRQELGIKDPFIVENGGAIYIPKDYFHFPFAYNRTMGDYYIIELGAPYHEIKQRLKRIMEEAGSQIMALGEMPLEEAARVTGLNLKMAQMAREREYSETLIISGGRREIEAIVNRIKHEGLNCVFGGRFWEVSLGSDKGKAVKILNELFKLNYGRILSYGLGDGGNDIPMFEAVDRPLLIQNMNNRWNKVKVKHIARINGVGPQGFQQASALILQQQVTVV